MSGFAVIGAGHPQAVLATLHFILTRSKKFSKLRTKVHESPGGLPIPPPTAQGLAATDDPKVGPLIRSRRRALGLTLQDLGQRADVSVGYLSQIERDLVTPTLGTLAQVARALGVGLDYFVAMPTVSASLVRAEDRRRFSLDGATQAYEKIGADLPTHEMSAFMIHVPPGFRSETVSHEGEEFIHVLMGAIDFTLDGETFPVGKGDSLHYRGNRPHAWANPGDAPAQLLWVGRLTVFPLRGTPPGVLPPHEILPASAGPGDLQDQPAHANPTGATP
jgi:transcriptional regulator with XRE-family HTH domain